MGHGGRHLLPLREAHAVAPQVTFPLQIVEPTLEDYSGHCHALVSSLIRATRSSAIDLWSGEGSERMDFGPGVTIHPIFRRQHRLTQMLRLIHRLLRGPGQLVLTTARTRDLATVHFVARARV